MSKRVFLFSEGETNKDVLGGKGASLSTMTNLGLPIPFGFTISTQTCIEFLNNGKNYPEGLWDSVLLSMKEVEKISGKQFGNVDNPLLVSVRSGAAISMPGMMDTVLNVGLNNDIVNAMIKLTNNSRFVKDAYRRLIQMFSDVVCNLNLEPFNDLLDQTKHDAGVEHDFELNDDQLDGLISGYLQLFRENFGSEFPQDPYTQLDLAVKAVFNSWNNKRAIDYRNHENIPHDIGTAVNIQSMVFGNYGDSSGTGVLFTRNPSTGENRIYGEFLINAQGEDVVAGIRTPISISSLQDKWPDIYKELVDISKKLEHHYKDVQDIEFTIEESKLYMLQTRNGKRTGAASAKIAFDLFSEGLITKEEAVLRVTPRDVEESLFPSVVWENQQKSSYYDLINIEQALQTKSLNELKKSASTKIADKIGHGLPAGPGAATGHVIFDSDLAEKIIKGTIEAPFEVTMTRSIGDRVVPRLILVKKETSPEDFHGMVASVGILTMRGGLTSHAALVGRQIGKRVIVGSSVSGLELRGDSLGTKSGVVVKEGDIITIEIFDEGLVYVGALPIITPDKLPNELETILDWADEIAKIKVRTNADKRNDTTVAVNFKTTGTGLARTEHQFFDALDLVREMILADTVVERRKILDKMVKLQRNDFIDLFTTINGLPMTIRLLDPPLHEFLPNELELRQRIWREQLHPDSEESRVLRKVLYYQESNPMLGLRGTRLGLLFPEITEMQTRAIIEAAIQVKAQGIAVFPEIMVPLVGFRTEFSEARKIIDSTAEKVFKEKQTRLDYLVGTMIEIPRAALMADKIAEKAEFFSFGTNDLTQMTFGYSRDDAGKFLPIYIEKGILKVDPFEVLDQEGVGQLVEMGTKRGRSIKKDLKVGICGEHGGEPSSVEFCYRTGLNYVSCSPYRVPIARIASAQAAIKATL